MIELVVSGTTTVGVTSEPIIAGSTAPNIHITLSDEWTDLAKIVVFTNDVTAHSMLPTAVDDGITCSIPLDLLTVGSRLSVGLQGTDPDTLEIIRTTYTDIGFVSDGADPSDDPATGQSRELYEQACTTATEALSVAESVQDDLEDNYYTETETDTLLAAKQDTISDLSTIRSGAALGATAVQPESGKGLFSGSYNDLTDTPTIPTVPTALSEFTDDLGSSPTHTHSQYLTSHQSLAAYRTSDDQDEIDSGKQATLVSGTNIKTINNISVLGSGNIEIQGGGSGSPTWGSLIGTMSDQTDLQEALDDKADTTDIPTKTSDLTNDSGFLTEHQSLSAYRTSADQDVIDDAIESDIDSIESSIDTIEANVDTIEEKIPAQATSSNQLADKSFVNSSIATNTANYISDEGEPFASVADLEAYSGTVTNNDYAFVTGTDSSGNAYYDRYKATVSASTVSWAKEFRLNNSSFTAAQWDAISSGITASLVLSYSSHISNTSNPHGVTVSQIGAAAASHTHAASDVTSGTLAVARGGTGQTTLALARNAMGLGNTTGALPVANGGTGSTTAAAALTALGAAASSHNHAASNITSGTLAVARGGTGQTSVQAALTALHNGTKMILTSTTYGTSLPTAGTAGRVFFKKVT